MAKNFLSDLSTTPGSNTDIVGEDIQGSANVSKGDNVIRNLASILAKFYDDLGGVNTVGGTGDAITVTAAQGWTAYGTGANQIDTGTILVFKAGAANTGATTVNVNALGVKKVRQQGDSALSANAILSGGTYILKYDAAYDTAAGAWVLLNPQSSSVSAATTTNVLTGTNTSAYATSDAIAALWEKGSNVASSGTISIGEGGLFHITGTTTITDIDFATAKDGRGAWLIFDAALTLTHNATTLVLPGGANITTAAGDMAYVVQDSSDNVYVRYFKADGTAVVASSGSITNLGNKTTTSGTSQSLTSLTLTNYKFLRIVLRAISGANAVSTVRLNGTDLTVNTTSAAETISGFVDVDLNGGRFQGWCSPSGTGTVLASGGASGLSTASTSVTLTTSASAFDAGSFDVYGLA